MVPYFFKSRLGLLNFFVLQWFTLRLEQSIDEVTRKTESWNILTGVVPLTGWWSKYKRLW